ncbi:hypothetical protein B0H16DRAFT_1712864 [Mycena metata]|uniref:Uncharacterized protein n=1 Tax=Mycena metata TaxID=1033252 RepID=A0AAD7K263_9AGAR|nr:hypothetical protein B0H16DRAFT_1712864 [Mycena metata]
MSAPQDSIAGSNTSAGPTLLKCQLRVLASGGGIKSLPSTASTAVPVASDLQRGEAYQNFEYTLLDTLTEEALNRIVFHSYDIACQCNAGRSRPGAPAQ